jgi:hypothetical protein
VRQKGQYLDRKKRTSRSQLAKVVALVHVTFFCHIFVKTSNVKEGILFIIVTY